MNRPTSDAEIRYACPGIRTWLYRDLARLEESGRFPELPIAVLYETEPSFGHWVALLRTPEGVEHFDSYGLRPDAELKWVPKKYRFAFASEAPHMVRLLSRFEAEGIPVNYNEFRLQARKPNVATCGRWAALRCLNSNMTTEQFAANVRMRAARLGVSPDEVAVEMVPMVGEGTPTGERAANRYARLHTSGGSRRRSR